MSDTPNQPATLKDWLEGHRDRFLQALPGGSVSIERFIAAASMEILNNQKLQKCDRASLTSTLMMSARYGLEVGALLGQAWIIPYNDNRQLPDGGWGKVMTAHFQIGYKGLIVLARRSKTIKTIGAETVYENDLFDVELGLRPNITHKLDIRKPRGEPIAYYCAVELDNGGFQFKVLTKSDAEQHRDQFSKGHEQGKGDDPWTTNFEAMALKTVIIKTLKLCPMSVEALEAVGREERHMEMRNVTNTGLDALPPPSEEAEIIREPVPEDTKKPEGARPAAARAAAAKAAGRTEAKPQAGSMAANKAMLDAQQLGEAKKAIEGFINTIVPKEDRAYLLESIEKLMTLPAARKFEEELRDRYTE